MKVGDRARCQRCGAKIVLVKNTRVISLNSGMWVHSGLIPKNHAAKGPKS